MRAERAHLSRHAPVAKAMDYMLKRWDGFTRFLDDGRVCLSNNAAERALRSVALGRRAWLFAGSDRRGDRAAFMYSLIVTAKLNGLDPEAYLHHVLGTCQATLNLQQFDGRAPHHRTLTCRRRVREEGRPCGRSRTGQNTTAASCATRAT